MNSIEQKREPRFLTQSDDDDHLYYKRSSNQRSHDRASIKRAKDALDISPTMGIGPDLLKLHRDLSLSYTSSRVTFDEMVMPRTPDGKMIGRIDVEAMKMRGHFTWNETYLNFIKGQVKPLVTQLERELEATKCNTERLIKLDRWLRTADEGGPLMWALSGHRIRRYIFPGAYTNTVRAHYPWMRTDGVTYNKQPASLRHLEGTQVPLANLEPATVKLFNEQVLDITQGRYPVDTMGPVSL